MQDVEATYESEGWSTEATASTDVDRAWWKESVVYQIYPRSFNDSAGTGVGDLRGVAERLDYLEALGVDVVWLTPVYESPNVDNGYDISDYRAISEEFGTMEDWEAVLDGLHDRGMKLVMDLVVNHTSADHEWFRRSRDPDSEYHDYYFWEEGDPEEPPNDWESFFGGPAWTYDEAVGEWYLHIFDERQPDLNWDNPQVRAEILEVVEWWLEKGIDGFRMDVIDLISKPPGLPDGEDDSVVVRGADQFVDGPNLDRYLGELFAVLDEYDVVSVGEMVDVTLADAPKFVGPDGVGMSMAFNFDHMRLDHGPAGRWDHREWTLDGLRETVSRWQTELHGKGWNSLFFGNHDEPRLLSRFGDDGKFREESAKLLATLLHTLRGTPYLYQGDELGMASYPFESLAEVRDVDTLHNVRVAREAGQFETEAEMLELVRARSRDNARTPMQWDDSPNAGFTEGEPWLAVNPDYPEVNVEAARADPTSVWHYYRDLIDLRHEDDLFVYGAYELLTPDHPTLWAYRRTLRGETGTVLLNFGPEPLEVDALELGIPLADQSYRLGNYGSPDDTGERFVMRPYEARVYRN